MNQNFFSDKDLRQIKGHGLTMETVKRQLQLFDMPEPFLTLAGPCIVGDGITVFDREKMTSLIETYEREGKARQCVKFVPASGAASRMFKVLLRSLTQGKEIMRETVSRAASRGEEDAKQLLTFMEGIEKFAFYKELGSLLSDKGFQVKTLLGEGRFRDILRLLLTADGLDYANLPKGLL